MLLSEYFKQLLALTELLKNLNHYFFLLPPGNKVKEQSFFHLHPQSSHKIKGQLFLDIDENGYLSLLSCTKKIGNFMLFFFTFLLHGITDIH